MAIEHKTYGVKYSLANFLSDAPTMAAFLNDILSSYDWADDSQVTDTSDVRTMKGIFYLTANTYFELSFYSASDTYLHMIVTIHSQGQTKNITMAKGGYYTLGFGKTSKGICICAYMATSSTTSRDPRFYNLYVGELTLADGTTTKGCIYVADDNSHIIATDEGISSEATFNSVIDGTRKGYLIPVTDSTFGGVFKDVYMMACAPVQYNKFKIADTEKKYLCGKAFCLED